MLALHRARQGFVKARTAQGNRNRDLHGEFGIAIPQGLSAIRRRLADILEDADNELPEAVRDLVARLGEHLQTLEQHVHALEKAIGQWHRANAVSSRLAQTPGIGPITATARMATIGDARHFQNGRHLAAFLGLVPKQHSSGGKQPLLGISKRGDSYLRTLLIHAVIRLAPGKPDANPWLTRMLARRPHNVTAVALANKNARIVWALMATDHGYVPNAAVA